MFLGGVVDMVVWLVFLWYKIIDMLEYGIDVCVILYSFFFIFCNTSDFVIVLLRRQLDKKFKNFGIVILVEIFKFVDFFNINMKQIKRGIYFLLLEFFYEKMLKSKSLLRDCYGF